MTFFFFLKKNNYILNNALVKFLSTVKKGRGVVMRLWILLYGCQQHDPDNKPWELFYDSMIFFTTTCPWLTRPASTTKFTGYQIPTSLHFRSLQSHLWHVVFTILVYLFPWPMQAYLSAPTLVTVPILPFSTCYRFLQVHPSLLHSLGQIHCIPSLTDPLTFFHTTQMLSLMTRTEVYINKIKSVSLSWVHQ